MPASSLSSSADVVRRFRYWSGVQGLSGLVFGAFMVAHLLHAGMLAAGEAAWERYATVVRAVYHHPVGEATVLLSVVLHLAAACMKPALPSTSSSASSPTLRHRVHQLTGWFIAVVIVAHVGFTRVEPLVTGHPAMGFAVLAHVLHRIPLVYAAYFVSFGCAGAVHLALGLPRALQQSRELVPQLRPIARRFARQLPWWTVVLACAPVVVGVASAAGAFGPVKFDRNAPGIEAHDELLWPLRNTSLWVQYEARP